MILHYTTQFKKDYKKIKKQNKDLSKLRVVIEKLVNQQTLESKYKDHQLTGNWKGHRDCHIEPDWLIIYQLTDNALILERTGSHSELFK
ncbi:MAG: type II toxin-antitoxin system YafQ family toxin [Desulfobacula sp.]|nr:type II toxin-antitoxin system YafQ family toxin [Desulfobacula sp.]MBT5547412.1 type II toxin-antitoxin system YafQ family toxin [Desulfobacula sp.]MBT7260619.1 type II toxin-antitoxin system YafQ family toxin [Desulfobacula sp.]